MQTPINTASPDQVLQDQGGFYAIFLTHWALVLQTITMVMLFISTVWGYTKLPDGPSQGKAPLFVRYTVALWYLIQPTSLNLGRSGGRLLFFHVSKGQKMVCGDVVFNSSAVTFKNVRFPAGSDRGP